ncbi:hypothetical protein RKE29_22780 [Streptomyces sp. B1866]|uniref:hypothetical protein n=1 Tax=Streptomyces sp. B1866 TaxID=3075431 RepID=UPI00288E19B6|nr:hypothetical protein [Streptomyces sp. B1866]MDT3399436.1 hypothetical protein [Streptomyces sp. B1866]
MTDDQVHRADGASPPVRRKTAPPRRPRRAEGGHAPGQAAHPATGENTAFPLATPTAFLLPPRDDAAAPAVLDARPRAREAPRLPDRLAPQDTAEAVDRLRAARRRKGLPQDVPGLPAPPAADDLSRPGRLRRRPSPADAALRTAGDDELEGRPPP